MYSKLFNTIFVHVPKTGGQSVEHVFVKMHSLDWRRRGSLLLRKNPRADQKPQHLAHLLVSEYCEQGFVDPDVFASCFKFATVRNPYDRAFSEYKYRSKKRDLPFSDFVNLVVRSRVDRHLLPQTAFVSDRSGKIGVSKVMRFESLVDEFAQISSKVFGRLIPLPHINQSRSSTISADMDEVARNAIYQVYECDFDIFRYPRGLEYHYFNRIATTNVVQPGKLR